MRLVSNLWPTALAVLVCVPVLPAAGEPEGGRPLVFVVRDRERPVLLDLARGKVMQAVAGKPITEILGYVAAEGKGDLVYDDPSVILLRGASARPAPGEKRQLKMVPPAPHEPPMPAGVSGGEIPEKLPFALVVTTREGFSRRVEFVRRTFDATVIHIRHGGRQSDQGAGIWAKYPVLARRQAAGLEELKPWLERLEPDAFAARYPGVVKLVSSATKDDRLRAMRAVAALHETPGIPFLVQGVRAADHVEELEATQLLANWVYAEYHLQRRRVPRPLAPLLPLFIDKLVESEGEPNVRSFCSQAIGCLADAEWLPWLRDMGKSRHGAVEHWAQWAAQELERRSGTGE
jgi:hypothetical protein